MNKSEKENKALITIKGIYKSFKTGDRYTRVLKNINLDICEDEFLVIFGPSGCGKSTILHALMGLEKPDAGTVEFGGIDMWKMNSDDRADVRKREMGIIYQQQNWIKALTVKENVAVSAQLLGATKEDASNKAMEMLDLVEMKDKADYIPTELSAGEQQKMGLARSLITNPKIIIADEPTGNLDVKSGQEMMTLLNKLTQNGITVVMVTHNPEYLKEADRTVFMLDGELYKEVITKKSNMEKVLTEIQKDISVFIKNEGKQDNTNPGNVAPIKFVENDFPKRKLFQEIGYFFKFVFRFLQDTFALAYVLMIQKLAPRKAEDTRRRVTQLCVDSSNDKNISKSINPLELTELSFKNLSVKKSRTYITILGVSLGMGFIVFLLSIGYGLERLVINEVTKVQDQNAIEVSPIVGSNVELNDDMLDSIKQIGGVKETYPLVNSAARLSFNGANTDVVVYGIIAGYLEESQSSLLSGKYLDGNSNEDVVINKDYLTVLGESVGGIIGKSIDLQMVGDNVGVADGALDHGTYKVVGVVDDGNPAVIYMNMGEMKNYISEGYSQLTVIVSENSEVPTVRKQVEVLGFETSSVMDTVSQVQSLFQYVRLGLALLGIIAFIIAILGMINTLTVSLLERTKEVGLLKTIGMKSDEIRTLFINESMLMSLAGGIGGVVVGGIGGFLVSLVISIISVTKGSGIVMINFLPWYMIIAIPLISSLIGFLTGLYPSNRAVKIPALDAIRYE